MLAIFNPTALRARTADSRPGPGPLMRTSMFFTPHSCAARPARSAATCAANGVDLREPLKPALPEVAQDSVLPWRSVIVMMVLLNEAWTWAMPSATFFLTFLRARAAAVCCSSCRVGAFLLAMSRSYPWLRDLAGLDVQLDRRLARALAGPRVGACALAAGRQAFAVAGAAVAAEVHQPLDRHRYLAPQVTFDRQAGNVLAQPLHLGIVQVLDLAGSLHAGGGADRLRARPADAKDRRQRDLSVLMVRDVYSCNSCHERTLGGT